MTFASHILSLLAAVTAALPPVPADGIRDDARVLSSDGRRILEGEMRAFTKRTGLQIFLDTNTFIESGTNTAVRAEQLLGYWSPNKPGAIMCVDRTAHGEPSVHVSDEVWHHATEPEVLAVLGQVAQVSKDGSVTEESLLAGMRMLMEKLADLDELGSARLRLMQRSDRMLAGGFIGCLLLGSVLVWLLVKRLGRHEVRSTKEHLFPEVEVGQRFGAPYGGGVIMEITYRRELQ